MSNIVYIVTNDMIDLTGEGDRTSVPSVFEAMMVAQDDLGQITWGIVTRNIAIGRYVTTEQGMPVDGPKGRVAVFDLSTANGLEVIRTTNWVNGHGEFPEITK